MSESGIKAEDEGDEGEEEEGDEEDENEEEGEEEEDGESDIEEDMKKGSRKRTIFYYTPEELIEKEKRRLARSKCCLKEIWCIYLKLIDPLDKQKRMALLKELEAQEQANAIPAIQEGTEIPDAEKEPGISNVQEGADTVPNAQEGADTIPSAQEGVDVVPNTEEGAADELSNSQEETNALVNTQEGSDKRSDTQEVADTASDTQERADAIFNTQETANTVFNTQEELDRLSQTQEEASAVLKTSERSDAALKTGERSDVALKTGERSDAALKTGERSDAVLNTGERSDAALNTGEGEDTVVNAQEGADTIRASNTQKVEVLRPSQMVKVDSQGGVAEIPTKEKSDVDNEKRIKRLQKNHALFKIAMDMIKEAASQPFLRIERPQFLDETNGRHHLLQVARTQKSELEHEDIHPSTISVPIQHVTTTNTNFMIFNPAMIEASVLTLPGGTESVLGFDENLVMEGSDSDGDEDHVKKRVVKETDPEKKFDFYNYPRDPDGNPIGKTTGFCHYCRNEILPFPPAYFLNRGMDINQFYCCSEYRIMHQEAEKLEKEMRERLQALNNTIDITPGHKHDPKKADNFPGFNSASRTGTASPMKSPGQTSEIKSKKKGAQEGKSEAAFDGDVHGDMSDHAQGAGGKKKTDKKPADKKGVGVWKRGRGGKALLKRSSMVGLGPNQQNKYTNTDDLKWDPYETAYGHKRWFEEGEYFKPLIECYNHASVVLNQSELYDKETIERERPRKSETIERERPRKSEPIERERPRKSERKSRVVTLSRSRILDQAKSKSNMKLSSKSNSKLEAASGSNINDKAN